VGKIINMIKEEKTLHCDIILPNGHELIAFFSQSSPVCFVVVPEDR